MSFTFGRLPEHTVSDGRGNVVSKATLDLYATEADALAGRSALTSVTTDARGRWIYADDTRAVVWVRARGSDDVYPVEAPESNGAAGTALVTANTAIGTANAAALVAATANANALQALGSTQVQVVVSVSAYGAVGNGTTDDTAAVNAALAATPAGGTLRFTPGASYKLTSLSPITKSIHLDLAGASFTVDPTPGTGTAGHPVFYFTGSVGAKRPIAAVGSLANTTVSTVTLTTAANASDFAVGDVVMVSDTATTLPWNWGAPAGTVAQGVSQGYGGRNEINAVKSISGSVVTLAKPLEWPYDTNPTLQRMDPLYNPSIRNAALISEVNPGPGGDEPLTGANSVHLVHFMYCVNPTAEALHFQGWEYHAVNFAYCVNATLRDCSGRDPFRPNVGGHGYLSRLGGCLGGNVENNLSINVRHHLDHSGSIDASSSGNVAIGALYGSYVMGHGLGGKRLSSIGDVHLGDGPGWNVGNSSFSGDFDIDIVSPRAYGAGNAVSVGNGSKRVRIVSPDIHVAGRGIGVGTGASDVSVEGGLIEILSGTTIGPGALYCRPQQDSADTWGLPSSNLRVSGTRLIGCGSVQLDGMSGHVILDNLVMDVTTTDSFGSTPTAINITTNHPSSAPQVDELAIRGLHMVGTGFAVGVSVASAPTNRYDVARNYLRGFATRGLKVPAAVGMRVVDNTVIGASQGLEFTGDLVAAKAGGARIDGNNPNTFDQLAVHDVTGDGALTLTGSTHQFGGNINAATNLRLRANAGQSRGMTFESGALLRWIVRVNGTAESGGNVGSDLEILGRDDTGAALANILTATRKGNVSLGSGNVGALLGFYGGSGVVKPAVTGSRGGNAALASLITALASQGLLTDSTTA